MNIAQPYRSTSEYYAYLQGATEAARALGDYAKATSATGGIPTFIELSPVTDVIEEDDVYAQEEKSAEHPDTGAKPDSEGASPDGEQVAPS